MSLIREFTNELHSRSPTFERAVREIGMFGDFLDRSISRDEVLRMLTEDPALIIEGSGRTVVMQRVKGVIRGFASVGDPLTEYFIWFGNFEDVPSAVSFTIRFWATPAADMIKEPGWKAS